VIGGLSVIVMMVRSGGRLTDVNYRAVAELYSKLVKSTEDGLVMLIDCSFCTAESRQLARKVLQVLREGWR